MCSDFSGQAPSLIDYLLEYSLLIPVLSNLFFVCGDQNWVVLMPDLGLSSIL